MSLTIKANHPVRKAVSELGDYWGSQSEAISTIGTVLSEHGFELVLYDTELFGDEGRVNMTIRKECTAHMACDKCGELPSDTDCNNLVFTWYKLREDMWKCIFYIS